MRVCVVLCLVVLSLAASASAGVMTASSLVYRSSGADMPDGSHSFYYNGYLGTFVLVTAPGPVTFTVRANGRSAGGIRASMHLHIGDSKASWSVADGSYANYTVTCNLPSGLHALRVEFSNERSDTGQYRSLQVASVTVSGASFANADSDSNALAAADSYIQNYRRGPATITILDANGQPIPAGTVVRAKLKTNAFNFGTCVPGSFGDLWWSDPNPAPGSTTDIYQRFVDSHFNAITPEACGKWAYQEATRDVVIMDYVDAYLSYAERHGLRARTHAVCWDNEMSEPGWVNTLETQALMGSETSKAQLREEISERIQYMVTPRAGRYMELDGINETVANPLLTNIYGIQGVADIYNEIVAASAGRARVYVNELSVLRDGSYAEWYRTHIQSILNAGGTVQGIGCQTNLDSRYPTAARTFHRNLQNIDTLELPISTTEYRCTMGGDTVKQMNLALRLIFGNDMTTSFFMWGFWRNAIYSPNNEVLANSDWSLTACGVEYERLMALWTTDETRTTDAAGRVQFTGFYGDYEVTVGGVPYTLKLVKGKDTYQIVQSPLILDSFGRSDSSVVGATEDSNHKNWVNGAAEPNATISSGRLVLGNTTLFGVGVGIGDGYLPADFELKTSLSMAGAGTYWAGVSYRESQPGVSNDGYTVRFYGSGQTAQMRRPGGSVTTASLSPAIDWSSAQCVRLKIAGGKHEVWVGSRKIFSYSSTTKLTGGYVSLIRSNCAATFDNLATAPTQLPAAAALSAPGDVKPRADGVLVDLASMVVTRVFVGFFYIEDANRSSAVRVVSSRAVSAGDVVNISGFTATVDGERVVNAWSVDKTSSRAISPRMLTNPALGGGGRGLQEPVWSLASGASSNWLPAAGLNNTGLLVRVCGQVTRVGSAGGYFYLDDGSGLSDGTSTLGQGNCGIRVQFSGSAYVGRYIAVTGISSCYKGMDGRLRRLVRVAGPEDIQILR